MKNHLVSDSNCDTCKSIIPQNYDKEWQIMLGTYLVLMTLYHGLKLVLSKRIRIGDTKYDI
jgi:hypothetical protein